MASANTNKYSVALCVALWTIAMIVSYEFFVIPQFDVSHVGRQACASTKPKTKELRNLKTPPWFALLADYKTTVSSKRNLYVWPNLIPGYRLGNLLFNYAATFGISWQNNRIPIWPKYLGSKHYDIARFFNLRIPVDQNVTVIRVSRFRNYFFTSENS